MLYGRKALALLASAVVAACLPNSPASAAVSGNLIVNGDAEAGYCTKDFNAATTLPGWTITQNSPDVICHDAGSFTDPPSGSPGRAFFAPGDQGDSAVRQNIDVGSAAKAIDRGGVTFTFGAWLGGMTMYPGFAQLSLRFLDRTGDELGSASLLPVTPVERLFQSGFVQRTTTGSVPGGTRSIDVEMRFLGTVYTDGLFLTPSGYADNISLTLSTPVRARMLAPPSSRVPRFDHVFMIMMENTDYSNVMADSAGMPFFHGLLARGTSFDDYHGVYHPSDENYLAISGGDTFAVGSVYWPNIHDPNASIADEIEAKSMAWKAYEQGMGVPCNASPSTVHSYDKYYAPDDAPFIHYTNISRNATRCRAHLVDTRQLSTDLKSAQTTPSFSWIAADDYYDGESAGRNGDAQSRAVQDGWLRRTIEPIFRSPAWRNEKSLLIVTWDEDNPFPYPIDDPDNHVAAVLVGSKGTVRAGHVGVRHYDHYSTGRTIEDALGIGPITANDRYATPLNEAFTSR